MDDMTWWLLAGTLVVLAVFVAIRWALRRSSDQARLASDHKHERVNRQIEKEWSRAIARHRSGTAGDPDADPPPTSSDGSQISSRNG